MCKENILWADLQTLVGTMHIMLSSLADTQYLLTLWLEVTVQKVYGQ